MHSLQLTSGNTIHYHGDGKGETILHIADKVGDGEGMEVRIPASDFYQFVDHQMAINNYMMPPPKLENRSQASQLIYEIKRRRYTVTRDSFTFRFFQKTRQGGTELKYRLDLYPAMPGEILIYEEKEEITITTKGGIIEALETLLALIETEEFDRCV